MHTCTHEDIETGRITLNRLANVSMLEVARLEMERDQNQPATHCNALLHIATHITTHSLSFDDIFIHSTKTTATWFV